MLAALAMLCIAAWLYLLDLVTAHDMSAYMPMTGAWTLADSVSMFVMWAVMMVAMMLPSVSPMVLLYAATARHRASLGRSVAPVVSFVTGYLVVWVGFSLLATLCNWLLHRAGLLSSAMGSVTVRAGALVLIAAGIYQCSALKDACLMHCRSPVGFLADHWRDGGIGAVVMGLHHGAFCVGCCWLLMALLFVFGVMNLTWIALLTVLVLLEKMVPRARLTSRVTGAALVAWGAWLLAANA